jgi:hypothetical protein
MLGNATAIDLPTANVGVLRRQEVLDFVAHYLKMRLEPIMQLGEALLDNTAIGGPQRPVGVRPKKITHRAYHMLSGHVHFHELLYEHRSRCQNRVDLPILRQSGRRHQQSEHAMLTDESLQTLAKVGRVDRRCLTGANERSD